MNNQAKDLILKHFEAERTKEENMEVNRVEGKGQIFLLNAITPSVAHQKRREEAPGEYIRRMTGMTEDEQGRFMRLYDQGCDGQLARAKEYLEALEAA